MAEHEKTRTDAPSLANILERLGEAGVDRRLTSEVADMIFRERAEASAKAARLFYTGNSEKPIEQIEFSDQLDKMKNRAWGLVGAIADRLEDDDDASADGVRQLSMDVAKGIERLSEAYSAEYALGRRGI
ncbi:MAG: hypothetical protein AB7U61_04620 [Methylocystis sp.]